MKKLTPKKPRKVEVKAEVTKNPSKPRKTKLSKSDPDYFKKIALLSVNKRRLTSEDYAEMARASHPRGPGGYHGGRPKKEIDG